VLYVEFIQTKGKKKIVGSSLIIDLITPANVSNFYETMVSISFHTTENEIQVL
jgi:hypothetical protein